MPVVPEKQQLDARVQGVLDAQFWGQPVASARVIAGTAAAAPCEPPPLSLVAPSGLSRTQLLIASHAAGLPLFPGWCEAHGGVVLDRVVVQSGRPRWWAALTGRLKAQRMAGQRGTMTLRESLSDPDNYALAATGRLLLSHATTLRAYVQADDLGQIPASFRGWGAPAPLRRKAGGRAARHDAGGDAEAEMDADAAAATTSRGRARRSRGRGADSSSGSSGGGSAPRGMSAALQLRQALLDGYELAADLAVNEPTLDSVRPATNTPLRLSIDVAPRPTQRLGPLLYRVGAHGVLAPSTAEGGGGAGRRAPHVLAAHMQGALALAGHATLWQASSKPWQRRSKRETAGALQAPRAVGPGVRLGHTSLSAIAPEAGDGLQAGQRRASVASEGDEDGGAAGSARRYAGKPRRERAAGSGAPRDSGPPLITPGQVQDGLQQTTWRLERLRTDLQSWASRARAGELLRSGANKRKGSGGRPGGCWSSFLPPPHLRVSGLVGVLGRLPLHHTHFDAPTLGAGPSHPSLARGGSGGLRAPSPELGAHLDGGEGEEGGGGAGGRGAGRGAAALLRQLGGASRGFMEHIVLGGLNGLGGLGSHLTHDVGVRLFAGGGASLQFGQMRRALLDFTRLEATVDLGLTGPRVDAGSGAAGSGAAGSGSAVRHPVFALDDGGAWHSLTLSAAQQLVGPVRLRADWRFGLDSDVPLALPRHGGGGSSISAPLLTLPSAATQLARHVGGVRPAVLDAAYGLDVILPGSGGLVRGVVWYSPRRGEGGIELRLL